MVMTDKTKITLSHKEHELVCNTDWILTKQNIIKKVITIFGDFIQPMQQVVAQNRHDLLMADFEKEPKISKGENYQLLPYVMLDYPRHFGLKETLAVRTMFWWGNFFSVTLQLSGDVKQKAIPALMANFASLQQNNYWICVNENAWQYHFEADNYKEMATLSSEAFEEILYKKPFIKIARKISLQHWNTVTLFVEQTFEELINLLSVNYLSDEKDL